MNEKEYATDESLKRWGMDGVYSNLEWVRRDGWTDPIIFREVTDWKPFSEDA